jgi:hypothetical protein
MSPNRRPICGRPKRFSASVAPRQRVRFAVLFPPCPGGCTRRKLQSPELAVKRPDLAGGVEDRNVRFAGASGRLGRASSKAGRARAAFVHALDFALERAGPEGIAQTDLQPCGADRFDHETDRTRAQRRDDITAAAMNGQHDDRRLDGCLAQPHEQTRPVEIGITRSRTTQSMPGPPSSAAPCGRPCAPPCRGTLPHRHRRREWPAWFCDRRCPVAPPA